MRAESTEDDFVETGAGSLIQVRKDLTAHARLPEGADVIGDAFDAFGFVGLGLEEVSDAVRHLDEMVNIHGYVLVTTRCARRSSCCCVKSRKCSCH